MSADAASEARARAAYDRMEELTDDEFRALSTEDLIALSIRFQRYCEDCTRAFETIDPDDRLCDRCQRAYLRESCPEAFAEYDAPGPLIGQGGAR